MSHFSFKHLAAALFATGLSAGAALAQSTTLNTGGSSLAGPTYIAEYEAYTKAHASILFDYEAVGSGGGQKAFLNNDITQFEPPNVTSSTLTYGTIVGTQVDIGASDAYLTSSQLVDPATGSYAESSTDGPLIQVPTFGVPITFAYNESGETGTLTLNDSDLCGVLSGKITDWHTLVPAIAAGTTIQVVYFSNSSGTTFLTTQHLNAVCTASNSIFPTLPVPITKYFYSTTASNNPVFLTTPPANFTGESASAAVAAQLLATANSLGYLSPDYTSIAPKSANTTSLKVASLFNATNGKSYQPTVANTELGLHNPGTGATDTIPPANLTDAMDPLNWVPAIPVTKSGYPIVGYGTMELSSCYASKTAGSAINAFLTAQYKTTSYLTIIKNNGFSPLTNTGASKYVTAVVNTFLTNTNKYNLNIDNTTTCASYPGR